MQKRPCQANNTRQCWITGPIGFSIVTNCCGYYGLLALSQLASDRVQWVNHLLTAEPTLRTAAHHSCVVPEAMGKENLMPAEETRAESDCLFCLKYIMVVTDHGAQNLVRISSILPKYREMNGYWPTLWGHMNL